VALTPVNTILVINRKQFYLDLMKRSALRWQFKRERRYGIAVGMIGYDSPPGLYLINSRAKCPEWKVPASAVDWPNYAGPSPGTIVPGCTKENPIKARWLGVTDSKDGVGIHGTAAEDSIGTRASHGCFRMRIPEIVELFEQVKLYTPVVVH
jgi:lipoprotein-anchoring transpeptidase ErfK/SrfK